MTRLQETQLIKIMETRRPLGQFYAKISPTQYIGVDNRTGDAWTVKFTGIKALRRWMNNKTEVRNK
jgi:hypothetical protein